MALTDNLVSYYKMDDNAASTAVDDEINNNEGTANFNTDDNSVAGVINTSLTFAIGSIEKVNCGHVLDTATATPFSITAWVNINNFDATLAKIVGQDTISGRGFQIYAWSTTRELTLYDGQVTNYFSGLIMDVGTWYFVAITYDGDGTMQMTVDDTTAEKTGVGFVTDTTHDTYIAHSGRELTAGQYDGEIDEVGFWNRTLTPDEITELYNSGSGLTYPFVPTGTNTQINIGDAWKEIAAMQINIGDAWKEVASAKINIGDTWKEIF